MQGGLREECGVFGIIEKQQDRGKIDLSSIFTGKRKRVQEVRK